MAIGQAKTKLVDGERIDINTNQPYVNQPLQSNGTVKPVKPITVSDLTETQTPATVPTIEPSTTNVGMLAEIQAGTDQFQAQAEARAKQAETAKTDSLQQYLSSVLEAPTQSELESKAYRGEVDPLQKELDDINDQIRREEIAFARQVERIQTQPGLTARQVDARIREQERVSLRKQADLYIIQEGIQGRYDSAKAIADRAVNAQMERQTKIQNVLGLMYQDVKETWSTADQRAFQAKQANWERQKNAEEEELQSISDLSIEMLQNGAPTSLVTQARNAGSVTEALSIGGGYIGLLERQAAARASANADLARKAQLLELALAGDTSVLEELGFDPNAPGIEDKIKTADEVNRLDQEIARVEAMLNNDLGLQLSAGAVQSPVLASFVSTGVSPVTLTGAGTALNYSKYRDAKADFLAKARYVATNLTTQKIKDLKDQGVSFTPLSNEEVQLIGDSSAELLGYAIEENGQIVGFTSEVGARDALRQVANIFQQARDRTLRDMTTSAEKEEINKLP